ncbi:hypothetical protein ACF09L_19300 [Streptomyces sp. NPDC014779]|uniref:hypothetical protein n=1 Tax=Streptomyces sp. NPDC014779 TaxID=3364911 RepID=UPI00370293EE
MPTQYRITYRVLPSGVGPDDYEPADLEKRTELVELSDPEPAGEVAGQMLHYGPSHAEVKAALRGRLAPGEEPVVLKVRHAADPED